MKDIENIDPRDPSENQMEVEPECTASPEEIESSGIECEYEVRNDNWWCTTHNCLA